MIDKIKGDDRVIKENANLIKNLQADVCEADKIIKQLEKQDDMNRDVLNKIKNELENERRENDIIHEKMADKIRAVEDEKNRVEDRARAEADKARKLEDVVNELNDAFEGERRQTAANEENALRKIQKLIDDNKDMKKELEQGHMEKEAMKNHIEDLRDKVKEKDGQIRNVVDDFNRKSTLNQDELRDLKKELDNERRKSIADEEKISKLEDLLDKNIKKNEDKIKMINE